MVKGQGGIGMRKHGKGGRGGPGPRQRLARLLTEREREKAAGKSRERKVAYVDSVKELFR